MANKKEVKDLEEAKIVLEKIVKKEKLTNYPILENNKKHNNRFQPTQKPRG